MAISKSPWYKQLLKIKLTFVMILVPVLFVPLPVLVPTMAGKCAYAILIMAFYWMTEVIPMAVTALLPIVLFPWLGIMATKNVCENYFKDANMLFFGGLMVAVAVEKWNLHKRIALRVLMLVGTKPRWLMFGFMSTTAFLSMWISNTATTAMMVPISHAVLTELGNHRKKTRAAKLKVATTEGQGNHVISTADLIYQKQNSTTPFKNEEVIMTCFNGKDETSYQNHQIANSKNNGYANAGFESESDKYETQITTQKSDKDHNLNGSEVVTADNGTAEADEDDAWFDTVGKGMRLSIAYAANIGGTATLTGTGPNLVLKGQLDVLYGPETGINFSSWFVFAFPNMMISLFLAWFWLMFLFLGVGEILNFFRRKTVEKDDDSAGDVIRTEYEKLGKMSFVETAVLAKKVYHKNWLSRLLLYNRVGTSSWRVSFAEAAVLVHFIVLALMWLTRDPEFVPGWGSLLEKKSYVSDSCVAITIAILLFMVPSRWPNYLCFRRNSDEEEPDVAPALLDWPTIHKQIPWNVMLLLGGGFAMAEACKVSGLSEIIGEFFTSLQFVPKWVLILILSTLTAAFTEVTSNVATATIFLPILAELARTIVVNPLYLMLPVTISASFAFMLPVATPPNAIVFAYGNMKILDMMKAGLLMNIVCLLVLQLAVNTWGSKYFNLGVFPDWADPTRRFNVTTPAYYTNFTTSI